jgi:hypothetical protein
MTDAQLELFLLRIALPTSPRSCDAQNAFARGWLERVGGIDRSVLHVAQLLALTAGKPAHFSGHCGHCRGGVPAP